MIKETKTWITLSEVELNNIDLNEVIEYLNSKPRIPIVVKKNKEDKVVILSTSEYEYLLSCTDIIEQEEIYKIVRERKDGKNI
jgi:PHD/YefM family antitoxin component YafN of YafNO toxin-antitoxin module